MRHVLSILAVLCLVTPAFAQAPSRVTFDLNFVTVTAAQGDQAYVDTAPLFGETATVASAYPSLPRAYGAGGQWGVSIARGLGVGFNWDQVSYDYTAGLAVSVPHPAFFNRLGTDADVSGVLSRRDRAFNFHASYTFRTPDAVRVRVWAGPSYLQVTQDMVQTVAYNQVFNVFTGANVVNITTYTEREADGSAWGLNAGGDVAYFFSRHVGVGGTIRLTSGSVEIAEPLSATSVDLEAGHTVFGVGLRLRF